MPKQASIFPITGSMSDFTFYHDRKHGYLVRRKGGPKPENMQTSSLENAREMGRASRTGKLIRHAVRAGLHLTGDTTVTQRLTKLMFSILETDTVSARGERSVRNGIALPESRQALEGFAFHERSPLDRQLHQQVVFANGVFRIEGLVPGRDVAAPVGATHIGMQAMRAVIDVDNDRFVVAASQAVVLPLDNEGREVVMGGGRTGFGW